MFVFNLQGFDSILPFMDDSLNAKFVLNYPWPVVSLTKKPCIALSSCVVDLGENNNNNIAG